MNVLSAFGDNKKSKPIQQFKRGAGFTFKSAPTLSQISLKSFNNNHRYPSTVGSTPAKLPSASSSTSSSTTSSNNDGMLTTPTEKTKEDAIFDFPDSLENFSEVKVMIASTRAIPEAPPKLTRKKSNKSKKPSTPPATFQSARKKDPKPKRSKSSDTIRKKPASSVPMQSTPIPNKHYVPITTTTTNNNNTNTNTNNSMRINQAPSRQTNPFINTTVNTYLPLAAPIAPAPAPVPVPAPVPAPVFDIFAFDPQPTSHLSLNYTKHIKKSMNTTAPTTAANSYSYNNSNRSLASTMPSYYDNSIYNRSSSMSINSMLNNPVQADNTSDYFSMDYTTTEAPKVEKKRKRNLVAHLKSASGEEKESDKSIQKEFDYLSDDEELLLEPKSPTRPLREIIKEKSPSPELSYEETMEMQLSSLMRSEFGESTKPDEPKTTVERRRIQYQPLNRMNVRVTFQKKK